MWQHICSCLSRSVPEICCCVTRTLSSQQTLLSCDCVHMRFCVHVCVCMCVCVHACVCMCYALHVCVFYMCLRTSMCAHMYVFALLQVYVCAGASVYVCVSVHVCIPVCFITIDKIPYSILSVAGDMDQPDPGSPGEIFRESDQSAKLVQGEQGSERWRAGGERFTGRLLPPALPQTHQQKQPAAESPCQIPLHGRCVHLTVHLAGFHLHKSNSFVSGAHGSIVLRLEVLLRCVLCRA